MMNFKKKEKGFTLIEMLVSMTLFSFVVTMALGALFMILKANEKAKAMKTVVNNLNMTIEGMSREIRVGSNYNISGSNSKITFKTKEGCDNAYYMWDSVNQIIKRNVPKKPSGGGACSSIGEEQLTGSNVIIEKLEFYRGGASGEQPRILIIIKGKMENKLIGDEIFNIQTTVSQRQINP